MILKCLLIKRDIIGHTIQHERKTWWKGKLANQNHRVN